MICNDMLGGKNKNYKNNIQEMNVILRLENKREIFVLNQTRNQEYNV